jgi:hypothetical protein
MDPKPKVFIPLEHQKTAEEIADALWIKLNLNYKSRVVEILSKTEEIELNTAQNYLSECTHGLLARKISPYSLADQNTHLRRLKIIYKTLEIEPDNCIVKKTKEINPNFLY